MNKKTTIKAPLPLRKVLELKYVRPTKKDHGHTLIILDQQPIGYFLPYNGLGKGENYHLTINNHDKEHITQYFSSRNEVVRFLWKKFGTKKLKLS